jgi:hypothetical protein
MYPEQQSDLLVIREHGSAASEGLDDRNDAFTSGAADVI